jgi:hypothetical protein
LDHERDADVFLAGYCWDEVELLKYEADIASAEAGDLAATHGVKAVPEDIDFPLVGTQGASNDADESGLAAA